MNWTRASVLVGLLWCVALLSVLVVGVLHRSTIGLRVVKNSGDAIQAHYLALAGIEKAKALLYQDASARKRSARNHSGQLYDSPQDFKDIELGRGQFSVFHQGQDQSAREILYGVSDVDGRLNVNTASAEELSRLYELTPDIAAAIIDWRDEDNAPGPSGAEAEYYASLEPAYLPRNGRFKTLRELLMVRGVSPQLLGGEDANLNGMLDPEEDDGRENDPPDNGDGVLDAGWSASLTVESATANVSAAGQSRVNLQTADESSLTAIRGITSEIARGILARRGQKRIENLADLLEVTAASQQNRPASQPSENTSPAGGEQRPGGPQPTGNLLPDPSGPELISEDLLMEIADEVTASDDQEQAGVININTASSATLRCLPSVTPELAQQIIAYRKSSGFFANPAWLLKVPGMTRDTFKQLAPKVTTRSETFRILSEGQVKSSGARKRIEVLVRVSAADIETLSWREDL